jgi:hypothetical protein
VCFFFPFILITQSTPQVRCQCDAVVELVDFVCFLFSFILIMQSTPCTVRCQCDAVVLIKIVIFLCFFSIYFNYAVPRPYTGKMSV